MGNARPGEFESDTQLAHKSINLSGVPLAAGLFEFTSETIDPCPLPSESSHLVAPEYMRERPGRKRVRVWGRAAATSESSWALSRAWPWMVTGSAA